MKTVLRACCLLAVSLVSATGSVAASGADDFGVVRKTVQLSNGMTLGYVELGDPAKPKLVFLHGYTNSSVGYLPLGRLLARDFHVLLLDQRGHGESDKPPCCYTRVDFAYDVKLLLDKFGIERAHIVGHSLGGMVAQTVAAYFPEKTDRLIVIASTIGHRSPASPRAAKPAPVLGAYDAGIRALKDPIDPDSPFMMSWWDVPNVDAETQRRMRRESARIPADIWRAILDQGESSRDLRVTADRIKAPTLLIFGGKDALFTSGDNRDMMAWLPQAQVKVFPSLGHSLPEEDPQAVSAAIIQYLRR